MPQNTERGHVGLRASLQISKAFSEILQDILLCIFLCRNELERSGPARHLSRSLWAAWRLRLWRCLLREGILRVLASKRSDGHMNLRPSHLTYLTPSLFILVSADFRKTQHPRYPSDSESAVKSALSRKIPLAVRRRSNILCCPDRPI